MLGALAGLASGATGRAALLEAAVALVPVNLAVEGLKYATNRQRPNGDHDRRNSAFPSSHAANAFAIAVIVARRWRRAAIPGLLAAAAVAYSRLYLNKHWCVDVLVGSVLGAAFDVGHDLVVARLDPRPCGIPDAESRVEWLNPAVLRRDDLGMTVR